VIDVGVPRHEQEVEFLPPPRLHVGAADGKKRRPGVLETGGILSGRRPPFFYIVFFKWTGYLGCIIICRLRRMTLGQWNPVYTSVYAGDRVQRSFLKQNTIRRIFISFLHVTFENIRLCALRQLFPRCVAKFFSESPFNIFSAKEK
jgi:hypothetical protein